jgi:ribosome-associated protein
MHRKKQERQLLFLHSMFDPFLLHKEFRFKAVRSSGKGGQHVNKVSTSVELYFNIQQSQSLNDEQKELILTKLKNRINSEGELIIVSQTERSQLANKKKSIQRFDELISKVLEKKKKRVPTKISKEKKRKRLENKKRHSEKKLLRKKDFL